MMLDTIFQHLGTVQCTLFVWLGLLALYLIKETTPYFLFTNYRIFLQNQVEDLFLKYRQYFRIPWWCFWRFLKMFLLFRSCYFCYFCVRSMKILWRFYSRDLWSKRRVFSEERYFSYGYFYLWNVFSKEILEDIFLKSIFDTNICLAWRYI